MVALVNRSSALIWSFAVIAMTGCQAQAPSAPAPELTGRMVSVGVQDAQLDYATLRFEIEVYNPLGREVSAQGLRYTLTSGWNVFSSATPVPNSPISPKTTRLLSFTHPVTYERLLRALGAKVGSTVPFTLESSLLAVDRRRVVPVHLSSEGSLFLPLPSPARIYPFGTDKTAGDRGLYL
jgi:hypothetical protein